MLNFQLLKIKLCCEYPALKERKILYLINGYSIDKSASLKENNISNGTVILINIIDQIL